MVWIEPHRDQVLLELLDIGTVAHPFGEVTIGGNVAV
jgi:hypothetical protein